MRSAIVWKRNDVLWIQALSLTDQDVWTADGPLFVVLAEACDTEKGEAILGALQRSRRVPHSQAWEENLVLLRASGVKTAKAFARNARSVTVDLQAQLTFTPSHNDKAFYAELPDRALQLPVTASPAEVGRALDQALALCE